MMLRQTKHFDCNCQRCQDPSELQTDLAALLCQNCATNAKLLPKDPLNPKTDYICTNCDYVLPVEKAKLITDTALKFVGEGVTEETHEKTLETKIYSRPKQIIYSTY